MAPLDDMLVEEEGEGEEGRSPWRQILEGEEGGPERKEAAEGAPGAREEGHRVPEEVPKALYTSKAAWSALGPRGAASWLLATPTSSSTRATSTRAKRRYALPRTYAFPVPFTRQLTNTARSVHAVSPDIACRSGQLVSPDLVPFATKPGALHRVLEVAKSRRWYSAKDQGPTFFQMLRDVSLEESGRASAPTNGQPSAAGTNYCTVVSKLCACHASTHHSQLHHAASSSDTYGFVQVLWMPIVISTS
jgi:hypothetical protein